MSPYSRHIRMLKYYLLLAVNFHRRKTPSFTSAISAHEAGVTLNATDWTTEHCNFLYVSLTVFYFDNEQAAMSQKYVASLCARRQRDMAMPMLVGYTDARHHSKLSSFCKNKTVK